MRKNEIGCYGYPWEERSLPNIVKKGYSMCYVRTQDFALLTCKACVQG